MKSLLFVLLFATQLTYALNANSTLDSENGPTEDSLMKEEVPVDNPYEEDVPKEGENQPEENDPVE